MPLSDASTIANFFPSISTDGANWIIKEVAINNGLVSRSSKDLEAFNEKIIDEIRESILPEAENIQSV